MGQDLIGSISLVEAIIHSADEEAIEFNRELYRSPCALVKYKIQSTSIQAGTLPCAIILDNAHLPVDALSAHA